jgi:four helix bundle protein
MEIFRLSQGFPKEETYSLTDQIRRSSRSVATNIAEGWRKRRYRAAFIAKLSDAECEAAETQVWIQFAVSCGYLAPANGAALEHGYDAIITTLVGMIRHPETWTAKH